MHWADGLDLDELLAPPTALGAPAPTRSSAQPRAPATASNELAARDVMDDLSWIDDLLDEESDFGPRSGGGGGSRNSRGGGRDRGQPQERFGESDDARSLRISIGRAARAGEHTKVIHLSRKWNRKGFAPESSVSWAALKACAASGAWEVASAIIEELEREQMELTPVHYECALRACDRHARWQEALAILNRAQEAGVRPNVGALECVLRACSKADQYEMVGVVWEMLRRESRREPFPLRPDIRTYNTLMRALTGGFDKGRNGNRERGERARRVLEAYDEAIAIGLAPDAPALKHALRAADIVGDDERALSLLEQWRDSGYPAEVLPYSNAMSACARNGKVAVVLRLLAQMRDDGLRPTSYCFNSALVACSKSGQLYRALSILSDMEAGEAGETPTVHSYAALLRACSMQADCRSGTQLLQRMRRSDIAPTAVHYGLVINACSRCGEHSRVTRLLGEMESRGLQPDLATFTTVIAAAAAMNQLNKALSLIDRMYELGISPDVATFNVLLQVCDRQGKHAEMVQLLDAMPALGAQPNVVNYNTAIRALGRNGDVAGVRTLMDKMRDRDLYVNISTYRAAINGTCDAGELSAAEGLLDELEHAGLTADLAIQHSILTTISAELLPAMERRLDASLPDVVRRHRSYQWYHATKDDGSRGRGRSRPRKPRPRP